jgi:hypothetical protein
MKLKMPPEVWGPLFWHTIHIVALGYPETPSYAHKKAAKEFFESLAFLIPCDVCRKHYVQHTAIKPVTQYLDRRQDLLKWTIDLHNTVNISLQKPVFSEAEVIQYYKRIGARGRTPLWSTADFAEADMRARIQGVFAGAAATLVVGTVLWFTTMGEKRNF